MLEILQRQQRFSLADELAGQMRWNSKKTLLWTFQSPEANNNPDRKAIACDFIVTESDTEGYLWMCFTECDQSHSTANHSKLSDIQRQGRNTQRNACWENLFFFLLFLSSRRDPSLKLMIWVACFEHLRKLNRRFSGLLRHNNKRLKFSYVSKNTMF